MAIVSDRLDQIATVLTELGEGDPADLRRALREYDVRDIIAVIANNLASGNVNGDTQLVEWIKVPFAWDTPGLVPSTGPVGIKITDLAAGDAPLYFFNSWWYLQTYILTEFDGSGTTAQICFTSDRGNLPGTPYSPTALEVDLTVAPSTFDSAGDVLYSSTEATSDVGFTAPYVVAPTAMWLIVDDANGGDPGMSQGEAVLFCGIVRGLF